MRALVPAQVDPVARDGDAREQRLGQLLGLADQREDGAVVVGVDVDVEQPRRAVERCRAARPPTSASRPSEKFGTDSSTGRTLER